MLLNAETIYKFAIENDEPMCLNNRLSTFNLLILAALKIQTLDILSPLFYPQMMHSL